MRIGDLFTAEIIDFVKPYGIAYENKQKILVPYSYIGDKLNLEINHIDRARYYAKIVDILEPSKFRQTPICKHFGVCGGCSMQHIASDEYNKIKLAELSKALAQDIPITHIPLNSRLRASFKVSGHKLGFFEINSHKLVNMKECHILDEEIFALKFKLEELLSKLPGLKPKEILVQKLPNGIDLCFIGEFKLGQKEFEGLAEFSRNNNICRISHEDKNGLKELLVISKPYITLGAFNVNLPPKSFLQVSYTSLEFLTNFVKEEAGDSVNIIDLFSGPGTYSFPLASRAKKILSLELDSGMVDTVNETVRSYQLANIVAQKRDLFNNPVSAQELNKFDLAIVNPPRIGATRQCAELAKSSVSKVIMISCNPETFLKDSDALLRSGYKFSKIEALDQFLFTPHLEVVSSFTR